MSESRLLEQHSRRIRTVRRDVLGLAIFVLLLAVAFILHVFCDHDDAWERAERSAGLTPDDEPEPTREEFGSDWKPLPGHAYTIRCYAIGRQAFGEIPGKFTLEEAHAISGMFERILPLSFTLSWDNEPTTGGDGDE